MLLNCNEVNTSMERDIYDGESASILYSDEELGECCRILSAMHLASYANLSLSCDCESLVVLNASEFEYVDENTVSFNGLTLEVQLNTSQGLPVVCANFSQNGTVIGESSVVYAAGYDIITYTGGSLSVIGCSLLLLTFFLFKDLRTFPAKIMVHVAITILFTNALMILTVSRVTESSRLCDAVSILLHFFVLSEFSWMTIMCFEVCQSFYHASRLIRVRMDSMQYKLLVYNVIGWSVPFLIVTTSVIVNYAVPALIQYGINPGERICWISDYHSAIVAFLIPIVIVILLQLILLGCGGYFLVASSKNWKSGSSEKKTPYFRVVLAMFFTSNIMWILGFMALVVNTSWAWYPFLILTSIQGFVIFFGFYGTKKVLMLYIACFSKFYHSLSSKTTSKG